ncbi:MAG: hypothetical protein LBG19_06320 [Prevotellaceae bacterium]|jgi:hypothetical protein|nr:hypothetical protein [Prevotellaceae bacterium]
MDKKGEFYSTTTVYGYIKKNDVLESYKCLEAILNSQLFWWYLTNTGTTLANSYFRFMPNYMKPFPFPKSIPSNVESGIVKLVDEIEKVKHSNSHMDCSILENRIDRIIYSLYNLTEDEICIIEDSSLNAVNQ